jgi:hypothetical protein
MLSYRHSHHRYNLKHSQDENNTNKHIEFCSHYHFFNDSLVCAT